MVNFIFLLLLLFIIFVVMFNNSDIYKKDVFFNKYFSNKLEYNNLLKYTEFENLKKIKSFDSKKIFLGNIIAYSVGPWRFYFSNNQDLMMANFPTNVGYSTRNIKDWDLLFNNKRKWPYVSKIEFNVLKKVYYLVRSDIKLTLNKFQDGDSFR